MAGLKIHYDGWVKLPAALLRALAAKSGDLIEVEPREGGLVLRARIGKSAAAPEPEVADPVPAEEPPDQPRASRRRCAAGGAPSAVALPLPFAPPVADRGQAGHLRPPCRCAPNFATCTQSTGPR